MRYPGNNGDFPKQHMRREERGMLSKITSEGFKISPDMVVSSFLSQFSLYRNTP